MRFAAILLPLAVDTPFDYAIPEGMALQIGQYVRVPVGRREEWGVVWALNANTEVPADKIKSLLAVADLPPMPETARRFIAWVARYSLSPIGNVLAMAISVTAAFEKEYKPGLKAAIAAPEKVRLSAEQAAAAELLAEAVREQDYQTFLLDGVTGSGKTEVYLEAIREAIAGERQALVLVPEIVLTEPLLRRFSERLGITAISWHSGLTPKQRRERWQTIAKGEAKLIVGARSALFLPYAKLGLIIADEEHEHSYKQEDGVPYHGRDMAVVRAHLEKIPIVLVSATPSLETLTNCESGKYRLLELHNRHGDATLPPVSLIDMKKERLDAKHFIAPALLTKIKAVVAAGEQALLFLNRRGYAPLTLCRACGHRMKCPNCAAWLVEHRAFGKLQCHHCGYQSKIPKACPECKTEDSLHAVGPGVERLHEEVKELLPQARVALFTSDQISTPKIAEQAIRAIEKGEIDLIIGTQMVAKGHHFPNLTLVGVIDADLGLEGGDLRASEKSFQMLHQVSGRAGREAKKGEVYLQTYLPDHPVMQALKKGDRAAFLKREREFRERAQVPPFGKFAAVILSGGNDAQVKEAANALRRAAPQNKAFQILGPAPAPLSQLKGKFRYRLLIKTSHTTPLQNYLRQWLGSIPLPSTIRVKVDVDPYSFV